jgi:hypothetical protein
VRAHGPRVSISEVTTPRQERTREAALRLVGQRPGLGQRELAEALREELAVGLSGAIEAIRRLESGGQIASRREGRRKVYEPIERAAPPPLPSGQEVERPPAPRPLPFWAYGAAVLGAIVCNVLIVWLLVHA